MISIVASRLVVWLDGNRVLDGVDLEAAPGSWIGVVGPNGSGKSTLLKSLAGLVTSRLGSVTIGGTHLNRASRRQWARMVSMVPQRPQIPSEMAVADYVLLGRTPHLGPMAVEGPSDLAIVGRTIAQLELAGFALRSLGTLSGGELQRAVLARAIAQQAPVLLLDEPTTSLDLGHQQQVLELVEDLRRHHGLTVVSALHDLTLAAQFCDRLILLADGRVAAEGTPDQVLTEDAIKHHFGAAVRISFDHLGHLVIVPVRTRSREVTLSG